MLIDEEVLDLILEVVLKTLMITLMVVKLEVVFLVLSEVKLLSELKQVLSGYCILP